MTQYGYTVQSSLDFTSTVQELKKSLLRQGFGVLVEIDMKEKLKEKIGKDIEKYLILGACNPQLAYEALLTEQEIGLLLPCNVIIYESKGQIHVATILPAKMMETIGNDKLCEVASQAELLLINALNSISKKE